MHYQSRITYPSGPLNITEQLRYEPLTDRMVREWQQRKPKSRLFPIPLRRSQVPFHPNRENHRMKVYQVTGIHGATLVSAKTRAGAVRAVVQQVRANAIAELATPAEIYAAGQNGVVILGSEPAPAEPATTAGE